MEKNKKNWPEVVVRHSPEASEAVTEFLFGLGAGALVQEETGKSWITRAGFKPGTNIEAKKSRLEGFLFQLARIFPSASRARADWNLTEYGDWAEKWKEGLAPLEIGRRLVVKPSWLKDRDWPGRRVLEIDPGLAFGTGRHATTQLCLSALDQFLQGSEPSLRILDVGTGSGILALAAAALSESTVLAVDNDPETMATARENLTFNHLETRIGLICAGPEAVRGEFDLILANLTSGTLLSLRSEMARLAGPGARLILSGVLAEQADEVQAGYEALGFGLVSRAAQDEWVALVMDRA